MKMWSEHNPDLQISVDATSISCFQQCPYKYWLTVKNGWRKPYNVDIDFGSRYHTYRELYDKLCHDLEDRKRALRDTVRTAMLETWGWDTGDTKKNRRTLIRAIIWAAFELDQPALSSDHLEVSFGIPLGMKTPYGEDYILCGYIDKQAEVFGDPGFIERKTSGNTISSKNIQNYTPNTQISVYSCASDILWRESHGYIELVQIAVGFCRFMIIPITRQKSQREESWKAIKYWVKQMEDCAEAHYWPMNENNCGMYRGCEFRKDVCSTTPAQRLGVLQSNFKQEFWDPTEDR